MQAANLETIMKIELAWDITSPLQIISNGTIVYMTETLTLVQSMLVFKDISLNPKMFTYKRSGMLFNKYT